MKLILGEMSVSYIKAILLLAFVLVNCEFGFSRPHPDDFKQSAKRDITFSNPTLIRVFRNRNPGQGLMRQFLGDGGSDITNNNDHYVIKIHINGHDSDYYLNENRSDRKTFKEVIGQKSDKNPIKHETSTEIFGQNPDQNSTEQEKTGEVIGQSPSIQGETSTDVMDQNPIKQETPTGVKDQNLDQKPIKEILQESAPEISDNGEHVSLNAAQKEDNASKYTIENPTSKNSKGCVPRFQSEIAIEEQKMLKYFMNLVGPQAIGNEENVLKPCQENEALIHTEYIDNNATSQALTNQLNFDNKPASLSNQPNTLVRDVEEDHSFLFGEKQTVKNNSNNETNNDELENEVIFPFVPIIPYIVESNSNITAENKSNPDISYTRGVLDNHESDIGSPVPIIPYKSNPIVELNTTPKPQRNPVISSKTYESEISDSKEIKRDIEKTKTTTNPAASFDVISDTTLKPQQTPGTFIVSEREANKRQNSSTNLSVEKSNLTRRTGHNNNKIKTEKGKGFISDTIKFIEKSYKPLNTESGPTDASSTIVKYIQKHHRNLTNEQVQKFSNDVLRLWKSDQISDNRNTMSTNKPNVRVNEKQNHRRPNSNEMKLSQNSSNEVSAFGLKRTEIRNGTSVANRGTSTVIHGTPPIKRRPAVHRHRTSTLNQRTDQDDILTSILSRVLQAVLTTDVQTPNTSKRTRRDLGLKKNKYIPKIILKSIARKFFPPKYFPTSGKRVFVVPGDSAIETLPANFRQWNYDSINRNLVDSNLERKEMITLADVFNGDYLRTARSNKLKNYSEEFEQIM